MLERRFNVVIRAGRHNANRFKVSQFLDFYSITAIYEPICKAEIPRKTDILVKEPAFGDRIEQRLSTSALNHERWSFRLVSIGSPV